MLMWSVAARTSKCLPGKSLTRPHPFFIRWPLRNEISPFMSAFWSQCQLTTENCTRRQRHFTTLRYHRNAQISWTQRRQRRWCRTRNTHVNMKNWQKTRNAPCTWINKCWPTETSKHVATVHTGETDEKNKQMDKPTLKEERNYAWLGGGCKCYQQHIRLWNGQCLTTQLSETTYSF